MFDFWTDSFPVPFSWTLALIFQVTFLEDMAPVEWDLGIAIYHESGEELTHVEGAVLSAYPSEEMMLGDSMGVPCPVRCRRP